MNELMEGRKNEEAYTAFFYHFVPYAITKMLRDRCIAKAASNSNSNKDQSLCTISNKAVALLLLGKSYN
jgi:hypothetical protein